MTKAKEMKRIVRAALGSSEFASGERRLLVLLPNGQRREMTRQEFEEWEIEEDFQALLAWQRRQSWARHWHRVAMVGLLWCFAPDIEQDALIASGVVLT